MDDKTVNYLAGTSAFTGFGMTLVSFNMYLETATLIVGFTAGIFALFFQVRRWCAIRKAQKNSNGE